MQKRMAEKTMMLVGIKCFPRSKEKISCKATVVIRKKQGKDIMQETTLLLDKLNLLDVFNCEIKNNGLTCKSLGKLED